MSETMRRTNGMRTSKVGKATSQDKAHALGQSAKKSDEKPRLLIVEMPETMKVIIIDSTNGMTIAE